jgi:hypothetical protein
LRTMYGTPDQGELVPFVVREVANDEPAHPAQIGEAPPENPFEVADRSVFAGHDERSSVRRERDAGDRVL